jgi:hypothetical protein
MHDEGTRSHGAADNGPPRHGREVDVHDIGIAASNCPSHLSPSRQPVCVTIYTLTNLNDLDVVPRGTLTRDERRQKNI